MIIRTRKLSATDTVGSRVKATGAGQSVMVPWDYGLSTEEMHAYAARTLAQRFSSSESVDVQQTRALVSGYVFETV